MNLPPQELDSSPNAASVAEPDNRYWCCSMLSSLRLLTAANAVGLFFVYVLIHIVSESHWIGVILTYFPRMLYPFPSLVLAIVSWRQSWILAISNLLLFLAAAGPIMDFRCGFGGAGETTDHPALKILSCNVNGFAPDFGAVLQEISTLDPDVVAFQEVGEEHELLPRWFPSDRWQRYHFGRKSIYSKYPLKELPREGSAYKPGRWAYYPVIGVEIDTGNHSFRLFSVNQESPRSVLAGLSLPSLWDGTAINAIAEMTRFRERESSHIRHYVERQRGQMPFIVVGDFNMPMSSSLFQSQWGDLQNAFDKRGFGYGFTALCQLEKNWPDGLPWARIDHILGSKEYQFERCITGSSNGSDHRLIMTWMTLPNP